MGSTSMTHAEYWQSVVDDLIAEMADLEDAIARAQARLDEARQDEEDGD